MESITALTRQHTTGVTKQAGSTTSVDPDVVKMEKEIARRQAAKNPISNIDPDVVKMEKEIARRQAAKKTVSTDVFRKAGTATASIDPDVVKMEKEIARRQAAKKTVSNADSNTLKPAGLIEEEVVENTASSATKKAGFFTRKWSEHAPEWMKNSTKWLSSPIAGPAENPNLVGRNLAKAEGYFGSIATKEMETAIKTAKTTAEAATAETVKEAAKTELKVSLKGSLAAKASKITGGIAKTAKAVPVLGVVIESALQIPEVFQGFKEGRGAAQLAKSTTVVAGTTLGAVALAALAATPVGWAAAGLGIAGGIAGSWVSNKIGSGLFGSNKGSEEIAETAQPDQALPPEALGFGQYSSMAHTMPYVPSYRRQFVPGMNRMPY